MGVEGARNRLWLGSTLAIALAVLASSTLTGAVAPGHDAGYFPGTTSTALGHPRPAEFPTCCAPHDGASHPSNPAQGADPKLPAAASGTPFGIIATIPVGVEPLGIDYDPSLDELFVANAGSDNVSVLSGAQNVVLTSASLSSAPSGLAYDSITGDVYVAEPGANGVAIISASNNTAFASLGTAAGPSAVAYDPALGYVLVVSPAADAVSMICDAKHDPCYTGAAAPPSVSAVIGLGYDYTGWLDENAPSGVAYDAYTGDAFVTEPGLSGTGHNVTVISAPSKAIVSTIRVGRDPLGAAYDETSREVAVANSASNTVSLISDATLAVVATVRVGSEPSAVGFDPQAGELFVANSASDNLSVISLETNSVVQSIPVGADPVGIVYDAARGELYVVNRGSDSVTVLSDASERVVGSVPVPADPWGAGYAAPAGEVFVTNRGAAPDNVSVISDSTDAVTATIPVGDSPAGLAYDSAKNELFVADSADGTVSVVSVAQDSVVATIHVGDVPMAAAYDPGKGEIFVANEYSFNVSVISDSTDTVVATVPVGQNPTAVVYDPETGEVVAVNYESADVSVISDSSDKVVATIPVGSNPVGAAYDSDSGDVLVTNSGQDNVSVVSPSEGTVVATLAVGSTPTGVAYDPATNEAFVVNSASETVSVIWAATGAVVQNLSVGSDGQGIVYDSGAEKVFVVNAGSGNLSVLSAPEPTYTVTFTESGLPVGTDWSVTIDGTSTYRSDVPVLSVQEATGTYTFSMGHVPGRAATPPTGELTVTEQELSEPVTFAAPTYAVTFQEGSLVSGSEWWVNLTGGPSLHSTITTISLSLGNGTYEYLAAAAVPGFLIGAKGSFSIAGNALTVQLSFQRTQLFDVTLTESGLPTGAKWWAVAPNGHRVNSTISTIPLRLGNGSYTYDIGWDAPSYFKIGVPRESFTVSGSPVAPLVEFRYLPDGIYFTETGLLTGTNWSVELDGLVANSTTGSLHFWEADGTYDYVVGSPPGYTSAPADGSVGVDGTSATVAVSFTLASNFALAVSVSPGTVGAPQPAPLTVTLTASASGGSAPYTYSWNLGDGTTGSGASLEYTYTNPGTYVATVTATDATGLTQVGTELVEVGGSGEMSSWIPADDAYDFGNPGSVWSQGGNCYGLSSTSVLYFDRQAGNLSDPTLPDDPAYYPDPLPYLSDARPPPINSAGQWDSFDNATLAIYLHQTSGLNRAPGGWDNSAAAATVLSALEDTGDPVVIALGPDYLHAVVAYGAQSFSNGSIEFAISDPNVRDAARTTNAWFVPPDSFRYHESVTWTDFAKVSIGPFWSNSAASTTSAPWSVNTLTGGWQLVEASQAVTVTAVGSDSFTDDDAGDSETFSAGIPGSAGIEEGNPTAGYWQAYLVPPGEPPVSVDPAGASTLRVLYGTNTSGVRALQGIEVRWNSGPAAAYTYVRTNEGFVLETSASAATVNLTVLYATDLGWDLLNATDLGIGAASTVTLNVTDWSGLNGTTAPSVEVDVRATGSHGPGTVYHLANGQNGLGAPVGKTGGAPAPATFLGIPVPGAYVLLGTGTAILAAVVIGVRRRRRQSSGGRR